MTVIHAPTGTDDLWVGCNSGVGCVGSWAAVFAAGPGCGTSAAAVGSSYQYPSPPWYCHSPVGAWRRRGASPVLIILQCRAEPPRNPGRFNRAFGRMEALHPEESISEAVDPAAAAQVRGPEHPRELESPRQTSRVGGDRMGALSSIPHGRRPRCPVLAIESDSSPRR